MQQRFRKLLNESLRKAFLTTGPSAHELSRDQNDYILEAKESKQKWQENAQDGELNVDLHIVDPKAHFLLL